VRARLRGCIHVCLATQEWGCTVSVFVCMLASTVSVFVCMLASVPWTCILTVRGSSRVLGQVGAAAAAPARRRPAGTGAAPGAKAAATAHVQVRQWGSMHSQGTQCGSPMLPPGRPITPIMSVCQHCACARSLEPPRTALHAPDLVQVVLASARCERRPHEVQERGRRASAHVSQYHRVVFWAGRTRRASPLFRTPPLWGG